MSAWGRVPVGLGVALALLAGAGPARADVLQDLGATFERVALDLQAAFPKVDARIVAVEGEDVRLEGPNVEALRPGLELLAYRRGELFRHPISNQPLGYSENDVAVLVVTAVTDRDATARVVSGQGGRTPEIGDGARITAGRIPVAVLPPLGIVVPGETADQTALLLVSRFSALLDKTGRFLAIEPRRVIETAAPARPGLAPATPLEVARRLDAPAVLSSRLVQEGGVRTLETAWISGQTGATLVEMRTPLARAVYRPRFAWEQTPELERQYPIDRPIRGLAMADLDGDGRPELVVGDEDTVTVYRWQGAGLAVASGGEFRPGGQILSVDAADINGTGRAQIVVVDAWEGPDAVRSTVLEMVGDGLRRIHEVRGAYLRVIPVEGEPWLVAQAVGRSEPFAAEITRLLWHEGRYRDGAILQVPKGVTVYGLALARLTGKAEPEIVALTPEDRLAVWTSRGQRLWTSADPYGGATVTFPFTPAVATRAQIEFQGVIGRILGRVIALSGTREGPEFLVFENLLPAGGQFRTLLPGLAPKAFTQGRIHRLRWRDGGFFRVWQSRPTDGYVADFVYGDLDGDRLPEVVVGVVPRGIDLDTITGRARGRLVLYELP